MKTNGIYIGVIIGNVLIELGKITAFTFLSWYFHNIWIMIFYLICAGGGMKITSERDKEEINDE